MLVGIAERIGDARDDRHHLVDRQQLVRLGIGHQVLAFQQFHRDIAQVVFLARIVDGDDIGVRQPPGGFGLAEEPLLHLDQFVCLEFLRQRHGLDRHHAADFRVLALINHAHCALAQFLLHPVAAEHGLFRAGAQRHGAAGMTGGAAQDDRLRHRPGAAQPRLQVAELGIVVGHVLKHVFRLVELALALEVQREVIQVVHQAVVHRHLAELVPRHVELALALKREPEHAVGLGRVGVGLDLARLGEDEALGDEQNVADHQQHQRQH